MQVPGTDDNRNLDPRIPDRDQPDTPQTVAAKIVVTIVVVLVGIVIALALLGFVIEPLWHKAF